MAGAPIDTLEHEVTLRLEGCMGACVPYDLGHEREKSIYILFKTTFIFFPLLNASYHNTNELSAFWNL